MKNIGTLLAVCIVITYQVEKMDQPGTVIRLPILLVVSWTGPGRENEFGYSNKVAKPARGQLDREN